MVAKGYKNILKQTYGDYMKLPPKEQQSTTSLCGKYLL